MRNALLFAAVFSITALALVGQPVAQGPVKPLAVQLKDEGRKKLKGLRPTPRHVLASAKRHKPTIAAPAYYFRLPKKLSTWGNNQYGCCVTSESAYNRACAGVFITEAEVIRWARSNGVLNGAMLDEVINAQQRQGFSQDGNVYGNGGGMVVNYADAASMKAAIFAAGQDKGSLSIGISSSMLPEGAGNDHGWFLSGPTNDRDEDHCVSISGYGTAQQFCDAMKLAYSVTITPPAGFSPTTQGYAMYTWNTVGFVEASSFVGMTGEVWIRNPSTVIHGTNQPTPDEVYVTVDPVPPPPPPPPPPGPTPTPIPGTVVKMTLDGPLPAGTSEVLPDGTMADIQASLAAAQALAKRVNPVAPAPSPQGDLEKRVLSLESGMNRIADSILELQKLLKGGK